MKRVSATLFALAGLWIWPAFQGAPGRVRPPDAVTCPRNNLTLYAGRVTALDRGTDVTTLTVATDWQTTERVSIPHPDSPDPEKSFHGNGARLSTRRTRTDEWRPSLAAIRFHADGPG
jgi:hypothetical protein